jgi:crossover junction endodeoxyribonuclease RuvC
LQNLLSLDEEIRAYDASDALAVAVCHHFQHKLSDRITGKASQAGNTAGKKAGGWAAFVRENPGKVRSP